MERNCFSLQYYAKQSYVSENKDKIKTFQLTKAKRRNHYKTVNTTRKVGKCISLDVR